VVLVRLRGEQPITQRKGTASDQEQRVVCEKHQDEKENFSWLRKIPLCINTTFS
jgi:hypothetical protein